MRIGIKIVLFIILFFNGIHLVFPEKNLYPRRIRPIDKKSINQELENHLSDFQYSDYIDGAANRFLRRWELKGLSMSVVKDGKLVFAKGYGLADAETNLPVTPAHLFRMASVSKLITAIAIMKLVDENKLSLDSYVFGEAGIFNEPEYLSYKDKRIGKIKIRHLLSHSGGWSQRYGDPAFHPLDIARKVGDENPATPDTYLKFVVSRRLHFTPGTRKSYSNMGYVILGKVIEKVSEMPYEEYVNFKILYPLGIYDMHLGKSLLDDRRENEVKYYEQKGSPMVLSSYGSGEYVAKSYGGNNIELLGAAGGWIGSSVELSKLLVAVDGFESVKDVLPGDLIKEMVDPREGWGPYGWMATTNNGYWWRTGSMAGTSAMSKRMPDGTIWVVLINTSSWKGSKFPKEINYLMQKINSRIKQWPERNLFEYANHHEILALN
ncbi:class A beta-lactamase-related serine hydrolase [Puteibacter caeruleilacunae]|nr:class A beta-lactamase-related serine hydrolase [Puteibacter caeruleilacunae]